jgi:hypothetical protein
MKSNLPRVEPRITVKVNKIDNIQNYDIDNNYPLRILDIIKASGTAKNCSNRFAKFIIGKGFKDSKFYQARVNRKRQTVDKVLREVVRDYSKLRGCSFHINFNALFQVNEVTPIPFDHCRLGLPDDNGYVGKIAMYDDWGCRKRNKIDKEKIQFIDRWNPDPDVISSQVLKAGGWDKYNGQIFWYSADGDCYPEAVIDPVVEDGVSDHSIKEFRLRNATTSFMPSHIIEYPYEFESEEEEQNEKQNWEKFQGTKNANKLMLLQNPNPDKKINVIKVDWQDTDKIFQVTNDTVKQSIIEAYGIPPVLANIQTPGKLGTAQEMQDAYLIYNSVTEDDRLIFEEIFKEIFSIYRNPINQTGDYSIIPLSFNLPVPPAGS